MYIYFEVIRSSKEDIGYFLKSSVVEYKLVSGRNIVYLDITLFNSETFVLGKTSSKFVVIL